jgi:hypothetical protein
LSGKFLRVLGRTCSLFSLNGEGSSISVSLACRGSLVYLFICALSLSLVSLRRRHWRRRIPLCEADAWKNNHLNATKSRYTNTQRVERNFHRGGRSALLIKTASNAGVNSNSETELIVSVLLLQSAKENKQIHLYPSCFWRGVRVFNHLSLRSAATLFRFLLQYAKRAPRVHHY